MRPSPLLMLTALLCLAGPIFADDLNTIYELALENDPTLKAAEANYRANRETKNIAKSALLPQVSANASYTDTHTEADTIATDVDFSASPPVAFIPDTTVTDTESTSYGLTLSQKIFDLPAWFSFQAGKDTSKQSEAQFAADQQDLIIRVAEAYFNVLRAKENLEATRAEERAVKRQLEQTQQRFEVGLIAITDVHEARAVYDSTVARRLSDEASMGTALEALTVLTGRSHDTVSVLSEDFPISQPTPADRNQWVQFALKNNYALKAATYGAEAARQSAKSKRMEHAPKINGSFTYKEDDTTGSRESLSTFSNNDIDDQPETETFQIQLSVPLYSGGGVSASRRQAYEKYNAAFQQSINTQRQVVQQTRSLHLTVSTDVQRVKARNQGIISAQSALDATLAGYEVGTRNIVDVLQSRRNLYAAIRDYANARFDYVVNMLKLKQQAGTLSPKDIQDLNKWLEASKAKKPDESE